MIVNLTPHAITFIFGRAKVTIEPDLVHARVGYKNHLVSVLTEDVIGQMGLESRGIPVHTMTYGEITGLPEPRDGVVYVVSRLVGEAAKRADVLSPDTGPTSVRDRNGKIMAIRGLISWVPLSARESLHDANEEQGFCLPVY